MKAAVAMRELARLAEQQGGLVTTRQAARLGVPRLSLARLADSDDLQRLAHGVYRVRGADADEHTELRAAWLAADPARTAPERAADLAHPVVVSHRSAAAVHRIGNMHADRHELTAPVRKQSRRDDVALHRAPVRRSDISVQRGMLVTTIERTIADLARTEPELGDVADALADAYLRSAVDTGVLAPMLDSAARRHGARDGAELLERMLELKGLDAGTGLAELVASPAVMEALSAAWAPAIEGALQAALRDAIPTKAMRDILATSNLAIAQLGIREAMVAAVTPGVTGMAQELQDSMRRIIAAQIDADQLRRAFAGPAIAALTRDLGRYDELARTARQATAGLPSGRAIREVTEDE